MAWAFCPRSATSRFVKSVMELPLAKDGDGPYRKMTLWPDVQSESGYLGASRELSVQSLENRSE
jgi:hypothetical protein